MPKRQVQQIGIMMIVTLTIRYRSDSKSDTEFEKSSEQCEQSKNYKTHVDLLICVVLP